ncbi:MAG: serine/threonine protein kinase [Legionellales bacterium]|nr:serine/threonine protein kinase [Legionellales bacterium]|tara:strand:- start:51333 stop:52052 length:720 start_codon:yes stop_codon:yes gene_type:complete
MSVSAQFELPPGRLLGRHYRVIEFLGHGWEGEVYKVEETATGIIRAAKLFYKNRYEFKQRTPISYAKKLYKLRACPIVIQYHHQDIVSVKGETIDFLVSDLADGEVLSDYIAEQPQRRIQPFEALHLFYAIVQGVEHIHFLGEYHGDIHADNIMVQRKGLHFDVKLIDLRHLGRPSRQQIQHDVYDLIALFYQMIGGLKYYHRMPENIKAIILGRKQSLINKHFKMAGHLRLFMENLEW